jgi:phospholipid/cholesterol/gamma-HCH transport system substrate-binding protein
MEDSTDSTRGSAARVGFVFFIAMLIVIVCVYATGGGFFTKYVEYQMTFPSTSGLNHDARVYVSGVTAGRVSNIEFSRSKRNDIIVRVQIQIRYADRVCVDSVAWIQSEGLLGDKSICILAGAPTAEVLAPGSTISIVDKSFIDSFVGKGLINNANDLLENASKLIKDVNEGKGLASQILKDPEWANRFSRTMDHIEKSAGYLESILAKVDNGEGTAGIIVNDPSLAVSLRDLFLGVQESKLLTNLVRRAEETGRKLRIDEERAYREMKQETDRVLEAMKK